MSGSGSVIWSVLERVIFSSWENEKETWISLGSMIAVDFENGTSSLEICFLNRNGCDCVIHHLGHGQHCPV